jgi:hypothetical protein
MRYPTYASVKVGVPGLINTAVTNLSVVALTAVAARLGRDVAIGYAMGARLEYILQPIAFGFGTAIVAMVGTNWGRAAVPPRPRDRVDRRGDRRGGVRRDRAGRRDRSESLARTVQR